MKKISIFLLPFLFSSFFFLSCESTFRIPGESRTILKNIAVEYYNIAEGYVGIKNYSKACEYYKLAMRDEELYLSSYYKLARAYALAQNWDSAKECYEELLSRDSENVNLKISIAYITAMRGENDEAIEQFRNLNEENPYVQSILENYITLLLFVGRAEDAEKLYFTLKEKFPDSSKIKDFSQKLTESIDNFVDDDGKNDEKGDEKEKSGDKNAGAENKKADIEKSKPASSVKK
ncbi:MAG: tetratricopeptide repeat protein [Treponema sp.]|nr:tetratricopeptide repeat protein [Treponema sp.]